MFPTLFKLPIIGLPIRGYGMMLMIGFLVGTWWAARRAMRVKADPDFVVNLGFVALIFSIVGARIFYVVHYWDQNFAGRGLWSIVNVSAGGLEFYGGFIGAVTAGLGYLWLTGKSMRLHLDIVAPSIMFGMGMARIGCFLNGCCWGGFCEPDKLWAVQFPFGSPALYRQWEERQTTVPAELLYIDSQGVPYPMPRDLLALTPEERSGHKIKYQHAAKTLSDAKAAGANEATLAKLRKESELARKQYENTLTGIMPFEKTRNRFDLTPSEMTDLAGHNRSLHVHPVQLYASIDGFLLAIMLNFYFYRRKRQGMVFAVLLLTYPFMRIVEEMIRIDNPHDSAGLTASQFVSLVLVALGIVFVFALRRLPMRSPRAVPWVPPEPEPDKAKD